MVEHVHSATVAPRSAEDGPDSLDAEDAPDPTETVEPDPGAVFDAYGAETVDELVAAGREQLPDPVAEADDAQVAALFAGELEAPSGEASRDASRRADRESDGEARDPADESDVLSELERAATAADPSSGAATDSGATRSERRDPDAEATDADVSAALDAAEAVYEGELPDEVPFE